MTIPIWAVIWPIVMNVTGGRHLNVFMTAFGFLGIFVLDLFFIFPGGKKGRREKKKSDQGHQEADDM